MIALLWAKGYSQKPCIELHFAARGGHTMLTHAKANVEPKDDDCDTTLDWVLLHTGNLL